jgi:hypothetical protein
MSVVKNFCYIHSKHTIRDTPWCYLCKKNGLIKVSDLKICPYQQDYIDKYQKLEYVDFVKCRHKWRIEEGEYVCTWCGVIEGPQMIREDLTNLRFDLQYNRKGYFNEVVEHLMGQHSIIELYPISWVHEVVVDFLECGSLSWFQVYKKFGHEKIHQCNAPFVYLIPSIMGHPIQFDNKIMKVVSIASTYKKTTNTINIIYCIYKAFQMFKKDVTWIPLKSNVSTLNNLDDIWSKICDENNWLFYSSQKSSILTVKKEDINQKLMNSLINCSCEFCSKEIHVTKTKDYIKKTKEKWLVK